MKLFADVIIRGPHHITHTNTHTSSTYPSIDIVEDEQCSSTNTVFTSSICFSGNNEILLENFTACMQMEDLIQFHNNGLYMESTMMPTQSQSLSLIQQGSLYGTSSNKHIISQRPSHPPYDDVARGNTRKRQFEKFDNFETNIKIPRNNLHPPVRRNQKLSDKITTLQKLVSPFGKTDTASVLQEASLYIKLLQEQIRNLCQMMSFSYNKTIKVHHHKQMCHGGGEVELRSKGLCLADISSITQKVIAMEDQIHPNACCLKQI